MENKSDIKEYIANCIGAVMAANISLPNVRRLQMDLAETVMVAARDGAAMANAHLLTIVLQAASGEYADPAGHLSYVQGVWPKGQNNFYDHLNACQQCRDEPFRLCPEGDRLIREAVPGVVPKGTKE